MQFQTTEAYISGGICGHVWWPQTLAGKTYRGNLRGTFGLMPGLNDAESFEDVAQHVLMREGGDFQDAQFTSDTEIVIIRKAYDAPGKYRVHVRRLELAKILPDHVRADTFTGDFFSEDLKSQSLVRAAQAAIAKATGGES